MTTATAVSTRHKSAVDVWFKDDDMGEVTARFSTFDVPDREGDIVRRTALTDGQQVPMVWAHDWTKPIGRGVIRVMGDHARFVGSFLPTNLAQEARQSVKTMAGLQQWSWGFRVLETQHNGNIRGNDIIKAEIFEVSPVLVGANPQTATLTVKGARPRYIPRTLAELDRYHAAHEQLAREELRLRSR